MHRRITSARPRSPSTERSSRNLRLVGAVRKRHNEITAEQRTQHARHKPDRPDRRRPRTEQTLDALKHGEPERGGQQPEHAPANAGRRQVAPLATPARQSEPARSSRRRPGRSATEESRGSERCSRASAHRQRVRAARPPAASATATAQPIAILATGSHAGHRFGSAVLATTAASRRRPHHGGLGNYDLLDRPLDPHADPPRPTVTLDHDLSNQRPIDRLGQLELNGQVGLVDRGKWPAIVLGPKPQPARRGRLDPRRPAQEPVADVGDP